MASHFIGFNRGKTGLVLSDFTIGAASGATDMELRVDDGKNLTREDVFIFLECVKNRIMRDGLSTVLTAARD